MPKITKDMSIIEIVSKYPETYAIFMKHGLHCVGCAAARFENIEQGAAAHGIDARALLGDLNEVAGLDKKPAKKKSKKK